MVIYPRISITQVTAPFSMPFTGRWCGVVAVATESARRVKEEEEEEEGDDEREQEEEEEEE